MSIKKSLLKSWVKPNALTRLLQPLSLVYRGAFALRKNAFDRGLLNRYRSPIPVLVVGNLTVGGTGKTPLVIYLVEQLSLLGFKPGVISRGYSGEADAYPLAVVHDTPAQLCGDEPALIVRRTNVPMVVGPDRQASIELLIKRHDVDLVISDDGLQHLALERDIEICLIDDTASQENQNLLPAGPYRESMTRLLKVDYIVRHGGIVGNADNQFSMHLVPGEVMPVDPANKLNFPADSPIHAVAGIGNPQRFFDTCDELGLSFTPHSFADHHHFTREDIDFGGKPVLMTEKDAVKCDQIADKHHWYLPVDAELGDGFANAIADAVNQKTITRE